MQLEHLHLVRILECPIFRVFIIQCLLTTDKTHFSSTQRTLFMCTCICVVCNTCHQI